MLSAEHRAIVTATVPILEVGGEALTRHFYPILFRDYPQVKPYFNQAHQADGAQPRALANAVLMYAKNIDRLEALGPLVGQIVAKHVALNILPEHYPMVGASLLQAIREVLGAEVATDAVIDAWAAAYGQLADLLIGAEGQTYAAMKAAPGGWNGLRRFVVAGKRRESDEITTFVFRPEDGGAVLDFQPGQYIGLRAVVDGVDQRRNYSLSAAPNGKTYQISVKRERGGAMSNHLHDAVGEGDVVELLPPSGVFTLAPAGSRPIVFISGGVGITPTLAMLPAALASGREVHFIHAARHGGVHAFRAHVDELASRYPQLRRRYVYAEHAGQQPGHPAPDAVGLLDSERLAAWLPATRDVDAYFLGPQPFMKVVKRSLRELGVPESQMYYEFFGPAAALE
ncbi:NO-inducible flavohemoprotein [Pseudoduganella albidiflava]|uniref:nitric oxide dioxygenase n=1 Tax=Pseudoduganella albidiflava TaxID=321983 RepID=A0A411WZP9_9BURK|nr:NO-inducible flavohemoprotein [Pseudoduganella albidiflava]QBI02172.1 NO-inducible flavohemoprotein [Pseudoduganella albidiflava]GGY59989.1 flavohemoprotein [Pseudoduganella albidiflava]